VKSSGIKVQIVCPGLISTDFSRDFSPDVKQNWASSFKVMMSPESVVECSMKDLGKNRVVCIPGAYYKRMAMLFSILPRSSLYKMIEKRAK
jgi:hypothetical protein